MSDKFQAPAVGAESIGGEDSELIRQKLRTLDVTMGGDGESVLSEVIDAAIRAVRPAINGIQQAMAALESSPQPVEHVLPFGNVCDCTQCCSVRATKSALAILRTASQPPVQGTGS